MFLNGINNLNRRQASFQGIGGQQNTGHGQGFPKSGRSLAYHAGRISSGGFTLIEVAVVIAIIAILAAIGITRLTTLQAEAELATVDDFIRAVRSAHAIYISENQTTPNTFNDFVTTGPAVGKMTISTQKFGHGGCTPSGTQLICQATDFPALAKKGVIVTFTLEPTLGAIATNATH
ncbi:MAG: prepilin-type N-terminal cleavage/methylation domain-containing protein [Candidatus Melainabacteria bacterium]